MHVENADCVKEFWECGLRIGQRSLAIEKETKRLNPATHTACTVLTGLMEQDFKFDLIEESKNGTCQSQMQIDM